MQKKPKTKSLKKGRVCKERGCKHQLSIYNMEEYCHVHLNQASGRH